MLTEVLVGRVHRTRLDTVDETVGVPRNAGVGLTVILSDVHQGPVERDLGLLHLTVAISDVSIPEKSHVGPFCSRSAKEPGLSSPFRSVHAILKAQPASWLAAAVAVIRKEVGW